MNEPVDSIADDQLLARVAGGDSTALAIFYDRHAARTLGILLRWLRRRDEAEDALQEVFWQVWRRAASFDARRATPVAWLFLIARSRALDSLRQRRPTMLGERPAEAIVVDDPAEELQRLESNDRVRRALGFLPAEQRSAIVRAFYADLTYEQVAKQEAIPEGTAKTRIRLGLRRLREQLRESEE